MVQQGCASASKALRKEGHSGDQGTSSPTALLWKTLNTSRLGAQLREHKERVRSAMKSLHSAAPRAEGATPGGFHSRKHELIAKLCTETHSWVEGMEVGGAELIGRCFCETVMALGFLYRALTQPLTRSYSWKQRIEVWSREKLGLRGFEEVWVTVGSFPWYSPVCPLLSLAFPTQEKSWEEVPLTFTPPSGYPAPLL